VTDDLCDAKGSSSSEDIFIFERPVTLSDTAAEWDPGYLVEMHVDAGPQSVGSNVELVTTVKGNERNIKSPWDHVSCGTQQLSHPSLHTTTGRRDPDDLMTIGQAAPGQQQGLPSSDVSHQDATTAADGLPDDDDDDDAAARSWRLDSAVSSASSQSVCSTIADARRRSVSSCEESPDLSTWAAATATVVTATAAAAAAAAATTTTAAAPVVAASGNPSQATFLQPSTPGFLRPRVHAALTAALEAIGVQAATISSHAGQLARLVDDLMSQPHRTYHTSEHVFELFKDPCDAPESTLAALLHDVVYIQIDGTTLAPPLARAMRALGLAPAADDGPLSVSDLHTPKQTPETPRELVLALLVFGHAFDAPLAARGQNELLSALLACHALRFLPGETLLRVLTCIEATIPFRDDSCLTLLAKRLQCAADAVLGKKLDDNAVWGLDGVVTMANSVAHRDVGNFAAQDARMFLINTWRLFPENYVRLRSPQGVMDAELVDWNAALCSTLAFFHMLKAEPTRVFHAHPSSGSSDASEAAVSALRLAYFVRNMRIGELYVGAHVICCVGLHSLATTVGLAVGLKLGDIAAPEVTAQPPQAEAAIDYTDLNADCYVYATTLLQCGRRGSQGTTAKLIAAVPHRGDYFDRDDAPLALLAARHLGSADAVRAASAAAVAFHQRGAGGAAAYLQSLPSLLVSALASCLARGGSLTVLQRKALQAQALLFQDQQGVEL
jgi:hypothetical protein